MDAIGSAIRELEAAGYIIRRQLRGEKGRITDTEYVIYERPIEPDTPPPEPERPDMPSPGSENPYVAGPDAAAPGAGNPAQLNINQVNTNQTKTNPSRLTEGNVRGGAPSGAGCVGTDASDDAGQVVRLARERIRAQIEYGCICTMENREQVDEFVEIMLEV